MSYSEKIKAYRESKGMTHEAFGSKVGVSRGSVQQWERGLTAPTRKNQPAVAKLMNISVSELMGTDSSPSGVAEERANYSVPERHGTDWPFDLVGLERERYECLPIASKHAIQSKMREALEHEEAQVTKANSNKPTVHQEPHSQLSAQVVSISSYKDSRAKSLGLAKNQRESNIRAK